MSLQTDLDAAKAEVLRLETEIAALPAEIAGKTENELSIIYHKILAYFKGTVPPPVA
jgi:hypothetical protein